MAQSEPRAWTRGAHLLLPFPRRIRPSPISCQPRPGSSSVSPRGTPTHLHTFPLHRARVPRYLRKIHLVLLRHRQTADRSLRPPSGSFRKNHTAKHRLIPGETPHRHHRHPSLGDHQQNHDHHYHAEGSQVPHRHSFILPRRSPPSRLPRQTHPRPHRKCLSIANHLPKHGIGRNRIPQTGPPPSRHDCRKWLYNRSGYGPRPPQRTDRTRIQRPSLRYVIEPITRHP